MKKRTIIRIDEDKCTGCGLCVPDCPEGALRVIDGKARLVGDLFCDGLGACLGRCPRGALQVEERPAEPYDEKKVMENIVKQGKGTIKAHLEHLRERRQETYLDQARQFLRERGLEVPGEEGPSGGRADLHRSSGCPGARVTDLRAKEGTRARAGSCPPAESQLGHWPVQLALVPPAAPFLQDSDLLLAADCVPFACADFHRELLKGRVLLVGCPKLDDRELYREKLVQIFKENRIRSVTCAHMEVPCCFGLVSLARDAICASGKNIPFRDVTVSIRGKRLG